MSVLRFDFVDHSLLCQRLFVSFGLTGKPLGSFLSILASPQVLFDIHPDRLRALHLTFYIHADISSLLR